MKNESKIYLGISGFARSGKDLYGKIVCNTLKEWGFIPQRFAMADELKIDVEEFLKVKCNSSPYTDDSEEKTKIRPLLVWYGCYQRQRVPDYWIKKVEKSIELNTQCNVVVCTDIRFKNEADWIHSKNGWLIHVSKYTKESPDAGRTWVRKYQIAPNEEEAKNDPIVKDLSDYKVSWEDLSNNGSIKINTETLVDNIYLKEEVKRSLQSCPALLQNIPPSQRLQ